MKHEIDLSKYSVRTDLAIESIENRINKVGIRISTKNYNDILVTNAIVSRKGSKALGKKPGKYITIEFSDITDETNRKNVTNVLIKELKKIIRIKNKEDHILIIGLGNDKSTPDSLGPLTVDQITVTNHLYEMNLVDRTYQRVSAFNTSVMGKTGIETSDLIQKVIELLRPTLVIVIDSLASSSISRVNKTIQMTDTGIHPGSGIGNARKEISKDVLGIPVVAIGVPTVVGAVTIVSDTIEFLTKHYVYAKKNSSNPKYKLITNANYLKEELNISESERKDLLGLVGTLTEEEIKLLIQDVLTPIGYDLMVTPKEIDFTINELGEVISNSLNKLLHDR